MKKKFNAVYSHCFPILMISLDFVSKPVSTAKSFERRSTDDKIVSKFTELIAKSYKENKKTPRSANLICYCC